MSVLDRFKAKTPEEIERRRFGLWALGALIVILPLWWFWGADLAAALLRVPAGLVLRLFGLSGEITAASGGGWLVGTRLPTAGGGLYDFPVAPEVIRRLLLGVPLFVAFMIAPPRPPRPVRAAVIGVLVLALLFGLSLTAFVWGELAPMLNPQLAPSRPIVVQLAAPPLGGAAAQTALIARYLAMSVAPLIAAIVLWAFLNPPGRQALLGALEPKVEG